VTAGFGPLPATSNAPVRYRSTNVKALIRIPSAQFDLKDCILDFTQVVACQHHQNRAVGETLESYRLTELAA